MENAKVKIRCKNVARWERYVLHLAVPFLVGCLLLTGQSASADDGPALGLISKAYVDEQKALFDAQAAMIQSEMTKIVKERELQALLTPADLSETDKIEKAKRLAAAKKLLLSAETGVIDAEIAKITKQKAKEALLNPKSPISVQKAEYGTSTSTCDAKPVFRHACMGLKKCSTTVDTKMCGDPAQDEPKKLVVQYTCGEETIGFEVLDGAIAYLLVSLMSVRPGTL